MMAQEQVRDLLAGQIRDPDTQWSLGTFGGIAEFSRDQNEPVELTASATGIAAVTERGAIAVEAHEKLRPFASESITRQGWSHRVALCLPVELCAMNRRNVLTELGADSEALREQDRAGVLFDIGLDALQADLCVRTSDPEAIAKLRSHAGRSVFEPRNPAMGIILAANPHRVFLSRIGRIEVYQPIPPATGESPDGPHTHVLPKLLKSKRSHPATEPVPDGWVPCAHFYPSHPVKDAMGEPRPFDRRPYEAFQRLMDMHGLPESVALKKQVTLAVLDGQPPFAPETVSDRAGRTSIRIALRQIKATGTSSRSLPAWLQAFDRLDHETSDEGDAPEQHAP
jgi:Family of unknown function (DUF6925)